MTPRCVTLLLFTLAAGAFGAGPQADFYVAPGGRDTAPGTADKPFATLARARDAVRPRVAAGLEKDITVLIRGGTYALAEPLVFGPEDSGTAHHAITYAAGPGETVVVSGGRRIIGWQRGRGHVWTARVPAAKEGKWHFRQLVVSGRRARRARTPNLDAQPAFWQLAGAGLSTDKRDHKLVLGPGLLKQWTNPADIEVVVIGHWEIVRKRLQSIDPAAGIVTLAPPHIENHPAIRPRRGFACYFENAREMLDRPGEWYLDRRSGVLTYWPLPGEEMMRAEVVAPVLTRLVEVTGAAGRPVRNLHFKGIRFAHTDWPLPEPGYYGAQACVHDVVGWDALRRGWARGARRRIGAAIRWEFAHRCGLTDGAITHTGGCGLALRKGCCDNVVEGNELSDIGGNAVMVGEAINFAYYRNPAYVVPPAEVPRRNRIANNHVHNCGTTWHGAVGVWLAFTDAGLVAHNLVHDMPYTGISVGWMWRPIPTVCRNNVVEHNHIHDVMKLLADGGGIYTLGPQPGTVLRGNLIHDVHYSRAARQSARSNNGIFFDQASRHFHVEDNVIRDTAGPPVRFNQCTRGDFTWSGNFFEESRRRLGPGRVGTCLLCNGHNFLDVPHAPALEPEHLTVEAWIRLTGWPAPKKLASGKTDTRRWIVSKNRNEWDQGHYGLVIRHDRVGAYLNIGGGRDNAHSAWGTEGALKLNRWHHLAMTYDGADLKLYLDGAPVGSAAVNKKRTPGRHPLAIGRRQDGYVYFKGAIDEARIYNRALSADEIKDHYTRPTAAADVQPRRGLVGHWGFDDLPDPSDAIKKALKTAGLEPAYRRRLLREQ